MDGTLSQVKPKKQAIRTGLTLYPEDRRIASELAHRRYDGNVALLVRNLLRDEWKREQAKAEAA